MYNEFFGLKEPPFKITPDTRLFFPGGSRGAILDAMVYAITSGEGIVKVIGEVGSGKTMLCRMLEVRLPRSVEVAYLANPSLSPDNILQAIAFEMKLEIPAGASRLEAMHTFQARLLQKHAENRRVVVFIEEAQRMPLETLEEIRLLSNLETEREKLLQIVLFGQPELDRSLQPPHIRQLKERITHSFHLPRLEADDIREYLDFRMRSAGYRGPTLFSAGAVRAIAKASEGLIRRINILADKALLAAFAAGVHQVTAREVRAAVRDSEFGRPGWRLDWRVAGAFASGVAAVAVLWLAQVGLLGPPDLGQRAVLPQGPGVAGPGAPAEAVGPLALAGAAAPASTTPGPAPAPEPVQVATAPAPVADPPPSGPTPGPGGAPVVGGVPGAAGVSPARPEPWPAASVPPSAAPGPVPAPAPSVPSSVSPGPEPASAASVPSSVPPGLEPAPAAGPSSSPPPWRETTARADTAAGFPGAEMTESVPDPVETERAPGASTGAPSPVAFTPEGGGHPAEAANALLVAGAPAVAPRSAPGGRRAVVTDPPPAPTPPTRAVASVTEADQAIAERLASEVLPVQEPGYLGERIAATRNWLKTADAGRYSIQLMHIGIDRGAGLEASLRKGGLGGELERVWVYRTRIRGQELWSVLLGEYSSYEEARQVIQGLPRGLQAARPFVRPLGEVRGAAGIPGEGV